MHEIFRKEANGRRRTVGAREGTGITIRDRLRLGADSQRC